MARNEVHQVWSDDELDRALDSFRSDVRVNPEARGLARDRLIAETRGLPATPPTAVRQRPVRRWLAATVLVGALVSGGVALQATSSGGASAQAHELLERSAALVVTTGDAPVKPGQYRYLEARASAEPRGRTRAGTEVVIRQTEVRQLWIPANPDDEWLRTNTMDAELLVGTMAEAREIGLGPPAEPMVESERARRGEFAGTAGSGGSWQVPTAAFIAGLSRDPDQLYDRLREDIPFHFGRGDRKVITYAADLLRTTYVPPDLRAALFRALTNVSGLVVIEGVTDLEGRRGVALGVPGEDDGPRNEIIMEPATGTFLGERTVRADGGLVGATAVRSAVADEIGLVPIP